MLCSGSVRGFALALVAGVGVGAGGGCGNEVDDEQTIESAIVTDNALTMNALTMNALTMNALTMNALTMNALTMNALTMNALRDPLSRELLKYVVSCALDEDDEVSFKIDGKKYQ